MAYICQKFVFTLNAVMTYFSRDGPLRVFTVSLIDKITVNRLTVNGARLIIAATVARTLRPIGH